MEFEELEELLELPDFKENLVEPQSLSMVIWSLGKLGIVDEDFLNLSILAVTNNITEFSPLMISNILYALSNIKFKNAKVNMIRLSSLFFICYSLYNILPFILNSSSRIFALIYWKTSKSLKNSPC